MEAYLLITVHKQQPKWYIDTGKLIFSVKNHGIKHWYNAY